MKKTFKHGRWFVEYDLGDGGRLSRLCFDGFDLMTSEPENFRPPLNDYGEYESRPVYGYDDCFPSVEGCSYPAKDWNIPDHGELCWLKWDLEVKSNRLIFFVESKVLPCLFTRILQFRETELIWRFEIKNQSERILPFQHVIHPLLKLDDIYDLQLPEFDSVNDEKGIRLDLDDARTLKHFLLSQEKGETHMLFIQNASTAKLSWTYNNGLHLVMIYPPEHFPAIGIWWNNSGYPDEDGCRRNECAFEPIPGVSSTLSEAYDADLALQAGPGETFEWEMSWIIEID